MFAALMNRLIRSSKLSVLKGATLVVYVRMVRSFSDCPAKELVLSEFAQKKTIGLQHF